MKTAIKRCLRGLTVILLIVVCGVFLLTGCRNKTPVLETTVPPEETAPPVFVEPELEEREVNIQTYYVIGEWANSRVVAGSEDTTYGPFRSQDFNVFTKWNPQANPGYAGSPGIIYLLEKECDLNKIVFTFSGKPYYFELYVSKDGEDYTLIADIDRTNAAQAYSNGICTLEGLALEGIRYVKLVFTGAEGGNTWVNLKEVEFFESGSKDLDTSWMIAEKPDTAVIVKGEPIGSWNKDHVNHGVNPMANSYDNDAETKWNPQALTGYTGNPGVIYTLDKPYNIKRIEVNLGSINHYFELYVSTDGRNYTRVANICTLNESRAYASGICKLDGLDLQNIQYVKMIFTGREDNGTWVNLFELSLYETGNGGSSADWRNPYIEKSLPITKAEISGLWNKDSVNHGQHPLQASYDNNLSTKWNPAANGGFSGEPGVVYTLDQAYTVKRFELTFTHDHHYFDLYVSADGAEYKKVAAISAENALKAYGSEESLVCTLDGLSEKKVKYIKLIFTGRKADTTWVNLVEVKAFHTGTEGLDISWMLPESEEPEQSWKIVDAEAHGQWLYDNVEHAQHPLAASYDGNMNSKWNPAAKGGFAGDPGVVYTLEKADTLKRLELTFTHDHHYFDLYVSADGTEYKKIAVITAENALKAYGSEESLVCTLDGLSEETVKYIKLIFTGRKADTTWVNLVEVKAFHTGTEGLDTSWMLPESEEPDEPTEPNTTEPETTEPETPDDGTPKIIAHNVIGAWVNDQIWDNGTDDLNVGPQLSYDGDPSTRWNPQASSGYAQEQGIIYTLNGWYDLEKVECTFSTADMYFEVYVSSDGSSYTKLGEVTDETLSTLYHGATCSMDGSEGRAVQFVKLLFTGRANNMDFVNLYEVKILGAAVNEPEATEPEVTEPETTEPETTEPETTEPEVTEPEALDPAIVSHTLIGNWILGREGDPNVGPQLSYDGNSATKWNPQASGHYAKEQGIIYTLNGLYDLNSVTMTFHSEQDMYFTLYGSSDGETYTELACVTAQNAAEYYQAAVCTVDIAAGEKIQYLKVLFTGRRNNSDYVNLYEVLITGTVWEEPDVTEPETTEPETTEPEETVPEETMQPVAAQITDFEVIGTWANDRIWDDGSNDLNTGPQLCCDGKTNTKWNPAVRSYTGAEGIIFTLDQLYDLQQLKLTFAAGEVMYFQLYGSADGVSYTPIVNVTAADTAMYANGVCTLEDIAADKFKYIKLLFTGKSNNSTWINFYEFDIMALPGEE